ncbi:MAG: hypothetical protein HY713_01110 [candidate division NC10 bacterium]|nr:hypothetical protein [candidate division NC10 bacterium]
MGGTWTIWIRRVFRLLLVVLTLSAAGCATTHEFVRDLLSVIRDAKKVIAP